MSTFNISPFDDIKTVYASPTGTSATTILTAPAALSITVLAIQLANAGAGAITVRIERHDGAASWYLVYDLSIAVGGNASIDVPFTIGRGETVKATTSSANDLYVTVTYYLQPKAIG